MPDKYLIAFTIPKVDQPKFEIIMDRVAVYTKLHPPYVKLPAHVTFHRPITNIDEKKLINIVSAAVLQMRPTRITVSHLYNFDDKYIVLPVHATAELVTLWVGIQSMLRKLPEYEHDEKDYDNTLHVTVATNTTSVFKDVWPLVQTITIDPGITCKVSRIDLYRKREGEQYKILRTFRIPQQKTA